MFICVVLGTRSTVQASQCASKVTENRSRAILRSGWNGGILEEKHRNIRSYGMATFCSFGTKKTPIPFLSSGMLLLAYDFIGKQKSTLTSCFLFLRVSPRGTEMRTAAKRERRREGRSGDRAESGRRKLALAPAVPRRLPPPPDLGPSRHSWGANRVRPPPRAAKDRQRRRREEVRGGERNG